MPINNDLESLRMRALSHFTPNATFLQRTIARIPVFFIALTAFFNEAILGLKSILFKATLLNKGDAKSQETEKTEKVSLKIFKLLWNKPANDDIVTAKAFQALIDEKRLIVKSASAIATHPFFSKKPPSLTEPCQDFLKYEKTSWPEEIAKCETLIEHLSSLKDQGMSSETLIKSALNPSSTDTPIPEKLTNELNDFVFDLNALEKPVQEDLTDLKDYLLRHFRVSTFNLTLIDYITNPTLQQQLINIFCAQIGSMDTLTQNIISKKEAFEAYTSYYSTNKQPISYELIDQFASSLTSTPENIKTNYTQHLKQYLQRFILAQVASDMNRTKMSISIPGYQRFNTSQEKGFIAPSFWNKANTSVKKLFAYDYFDHLTAYYQSTLGLNFDEAQRKALIAMFSLTQALDATPCNYMTSAMLSFIASLQEKGKLPEDILCVQAGGSLTNMNIPDKNHITISAKEPITERKLLRNITLQLGQDSFFNIPYLSVFEITIKGANVVLTFKENKILYDKIHKQQEF